MPAQGTVLVGGVDGFAGAGEGGSDVGKVEQRGEWIHVNTVTGKSSETRGAQTSAELARFAQ
ncbi:hypothetical protein Aph02nite_71900 [Actinoplanes philippinensis]|nr:hypothetical protein Aph02nite_71900 [Actinoplanes philippinensis]